MGSLPSCCGNVCKEVLLGCWYNVKKKIIAYPLSPFLFRSCLTKPPMKYSKMANNAALRRVASQELYCTIPVAILPVWQVAIWNEGIICNKLE